jgi:UDP-N-acetylmuramate--alanine ligase
MTLEQYKYIYFLGIGGIGMSALARWFNVNGFEVAGYDRTSTPLTDALTNEGVTPHFTDDVAQIPLHFRQNVEQTLVILTPAIPQNHAEYNYLKNNGFTIQKRSQVLGLLASGMFTIAVAGTHGKTTTSAMMSHLLRHSGVNCAAFLGGITQNYGTNLLINERTDDLSSVYCVVEADEFDRSFLTLYPNIAIVTSTDADHLDIYGDHSALLESFGLFVAQIKPDGQLFMRTGLKIADKTLATVNEYAIDEGQYYAQNIRIEDACFIFDFVSPTVVIENLTMQVPGYHNVENMVAAVAVALKIGVSIEKIKAAVASFGGVKRRFEYHIKNAKNVFIDDYAHHPTEVSAFLKSVKGLYPDRHVTAIFQPHLFTRTRDFAKGFAESLSIADTVILLDIYPARELPIEGVTAQMIFKDITTKHKIQCTKNELLDLLKTVEKDVVVTIGAGDIDTQVQLIKNLLSDEA